MAYNKGPIALEGKGDKSAALSEYRLELELDPKSELARIGLDGLTKRSLE